MLGATFTEEQGEIRFSMARRPRPPCRTRSLTKVGPNATVQSSDTFILDNRNQSMERTIVLWSKCRAHPSHLHFPPYHVERICQRLRSRAYSVPTQTIDIRLQPTEASILRKQLTSEGAAGQLADDRGLIRRRDYAPECFVGGKVNAHVWGHTHRCGYHATIECPNPALFSHDFDRHPPHREVFRRPCGMLSCAW